MLRCSLVLGVRLGSRSSVCSTLPRLMSSDTEQKETVQAARLMLSRVDVPELARQVRSEDPQARKDPDAKASVCTMSAMEEVSFLGPGRSRS
jgi:hypothetical protein